MWAKTFDPLDQAAAFAEPPSLIMVFGASAALRAAGVLSDLAQRFPGAVQIGCSTGSTVESLTIEEDGLTALAIGFSDTRVTLHTYPLAEIGQSRAAGAALARDLAAPDLGGVFLVSVGLDVNGSEIVAGMQEVLGPDVPLSGGLAGDGARFEQTLVAINGQAVSGTIAAIAFHGEAIRIAHGCFGGWDEFGPKRAITASRGNVLQQLDGKPALDLYESYLGPEAAELPASGLLYPLKVWNPANPDDQYVRTLLAIDRDARTLTFAGDVPEGWSAQLMRGTIDRLVNGAANAAHEASNALRQQGVEPQLCLFVSCVGRRLLLGQRTEEEVEAVADVIGANVPLSGFYSYGEIAPLGGRTSAGLHNQTVTLTLMGERA